MSTKFSNSITGGFGAIGEPNVAVCLLPGTEVAFEKEVECEQALGYFPNRMPVKKFGEKVARFRQVKKDQPNVHHDALEFPDGQIVLLTSLCQGQQATVLQLPSPPRTVEEAEEQKRVAVVAQSISARGSAVGEIGVIAEPKRKPDQDDSARHERERRHEENALDEALKDMRNGRLSAPWRPPGSAERTC